MKKTNFILIAIALFGLATPWLPDAILFLIVLFTGSTLNEAVYLNVLIYLVVITTIISPFSILCWSLALSEFLGYKWHKKIRIIGIILIILFEVILFSFVFIDLSFIGLFTGPFDYQWSLFTSIYYLSAIAIVFITGIIFCRISFRSEDPEIKLKGQLILIAIFCFVLGAMIPYISYSIIALIISRIILLICSIMFYLGFLLPERFKLLIFREK